MSGLLNFVRCISDEFWWRKGKEEEIFKLTTPRIETNSTQISSPVNCFIDLILSINTS